MRGFLSDCGVYFLSMGDLDRDLERNVLGLYQKIKIIWKRVEVISPLSGVLERVT